MAKFAVVNNESKEVTNIVVWEGAIWMAPRGHLVVQSDTAKIGQIYDVENNTFSDREGE